MKFFYIISVVNYLAFVAVRYKISVGTVADILQYQTKGYVDFKSVLTTFINILYLLNQRIKT